MTVSECKPCSFPPCLTRLMRVLSFGLLLLLAGCGSRVELFSSASESEANEVVSVLLDAGINTTKSAVKTGVSVSVDSQDVAHALDILRIRGLPRDRFDGMGQIFRKEGLVSSPLEERARYLYALSQELSGTLNQMDGVVTARVHVVLPERGNVGEAALPSTAAVFIKHQMGYNLDALQPQIRKLVTYSIPGLTEDRVSIALVAAQPLISGRTESVSQHSVLGIKVADESSRSLIMIFSVMGALVLILLSALGYFVFKSGVLKKNNLRRTQVGSDRNSTMNEPTLNEKAS